MNRKILIVEDEKAIREMVVFALSRHGFLCEEAADVREAQERVITSVPDLILLDWMLPGMSGLDYARRLRKESLTREIPIILLTARGQEDDRILGLNSGADDYLVKPFSTRELIARINAVLRRSSPVGEDEVVSCNGLTVDLAAHRAFAGEDILNLGPTEFRLLSFMLTHPERVYSRSQLLDHVWGGDAYVDERTVDVHIRRVRKALEPFEYHKYIQTVRGAGYRFSTTIN
ncbi:MAG: phosphate regulon transcriptional regulator PhoB [Xanthomonadales bacterium]|nr:phosphate regulon transcriptional regulator PhoB [Xanthomonadales bacterium]